MSRGREDRLRVPDPVRGEVLGDLEPQPPEVVQLREQAAERDVLVDEVSGTVEAPALRSQTRRGRDAVPIDELPDRLDAHRALEVDVELDLRQLTEIAHAHDGTRR